MSGTDWTQTPNLKLYKPIYDHDVETWGDHLNANADTLDAAVGGGTAIGYPNMQAPQPAGGLTSSPFPFGNFNEATAFSAQMVPPDALGRPAWPQVGGYWHLYNMAQNNDGGGGSVVLYAGADSRAPTTITIASANYTATTMVPSLPLTPTQVSFIQQAININNQRATLIPAGFDNLGMLINTQHSPLYVGAITGVAVDGTSITVLGWYQLGNSAAGQVPSNAVGAIINPATHMWCINGVMGLQAGTAVNGMTYLEADCYNYQSAFTGTGPANFLGLSINGNGPNAGAYGVLALNNWYAGFLAQGNTTFGYLCQGGRSGSTSPAFGFVSQVPSNIAGGHHPFGYYDFALAVPQYRWSVTSNGGINCGAAAYDNGFSIGVAAPGSTPNITVFGPDTNVNLRLGTQGTGIIDCGGDLQRNANSGGGIPLPLINTSGINLQGADGGFPGISVTSYAQRCVLMFRRGDGGRTSTTGLVNNDLIGAIYAAGYDTSVWSSQACGLTMSAGGTWSASSHPTYLSFANCSAASTALNERMRIFPTGNIMVQPAGGTFTDDAANALQVTGSIRIGTAGTGPTWTSGAGVPASTQPVGSLYSNTSGAAGARLYVSAGGGTWTAVAGV